LLHVFGYDGGRNPRYGITANVFANCTDDPVVTGGEHDDRPAEANWLDPGIIVDRMICDYDDDWYRFSASAGDTIRADIIFETGAGPHQDLDALLLNPMGEIIGIGYGSGDDEAIVGSAATEGVYSLGVLGANGAINRYHLMLTINGAGPGSRRIEASPERPIPDLGDPGPTELVYPLAAEWPAGAMVTGVLVRDLIIEHDCVTDLEVYIEMGDQKVPLWNRDGENCKDGGRDDDWLFWTSDNIDFDDRSYGQLDGAALTEPSLVVRDHLRGSIGSLDDVDIEIFFVE
jgi:hypothetical protein